MQTIHLDEAPEAEPISLIVALQVGRRAKREFPRIRGSSGMLDPVLSDPKNESALLFFDSKLNLARDFTHNGDLIEGDFKELNPGDGGAAIFDAVAYSAKLLNKRPKGRQRVLLLISETRDHGSHFAKLDEVVRLIGTTNYDGVRALPFSPYRSPQLDVLRGTNKDEWQPGVDILSKLIAARQAMRTDAPKALASMTGGECEMFFSHKGFETEMSSFANHLHSRYLLSFQPRDPHPGLHEIRAHVKDAPENGTVLFRKSYWGGDLNQ